MTGNERSDPSTPAELAEEIARLQRVQAEVETESARILDAARQTAAEIVRQAEAEAEELRSRQGTRDREILAAIGQRIIAMGDAYREAMISARKAVEQMAELTLQSTADWHTAPSGSDEEAAGPSADVSVRGSPRTPR
jgi:vacuolar-type H+-ATPase subunit H